MSHSQEISCEWEQCLLHDQESIVKRVQQLESSWKCFKSFLVIVLLFILLGQFHIYFTLATKEDGEMMKSDMTEIKLQGIRIQDALKQSYDLLANKLDKKQQGQSDQATRVFLSDLVEQMQSESKKIVVQVGVEIKEKIENMSRVLDQQSQFTANSLAGQLDIIQSNITNLMNETRQQYESMVQVGQALRMFKQQHNNSLLNLSGQIVQEIKVSMDNMSRVLGQQSQSMSNSLVNIQSNLSQLVNETRQQSEGVVQVGQALRIFKQENNNSLISLSGQIVQGMNNMSNVLVQQSQSFSNSLVDIRDSISRLEKVVINKTEGGQLMIVKVIDDKVFDMKQQMNGVSDRVIFKLDRILNDTDILSVYQISYDKTQDKVLSGHSDTVLSVAITQDQR